MASNNNLKLLWNWITSEKWELRPWPVCIWFWRPARLWPLYALAWPLSLVFSAMLRRVWTLQARCLFYFGQREVCPAAPGGLGISAVGRDDHQAGLGQVQGAHFYYYWDLLLIVSRLIQKVKHWGRALLILAGGLAAWRFRIPHPRPSYLPSSWFFWMSKITTSHYLKREHSCFIYVSCLDNNIFFNI